MHTNILFNPLWSKNLKQFHFLKEKEPRALSSEILLILLFAASNQVKGIVPSTIFQEYVSFLYENEVHLAAG